MRMESILCIGAHFLFFIFFSIMTENETLGDLIEISIRDFLENNIGDLVIKNKVCMFWY